MAVAVTDAEQALSSRIFSAALSFVVGVVFGVLATVGHQSWLSLWGVRVPWGIICALIGVAALLVGLRLLVGRLAAVSAAAGIVLAVFLLTLPSPGGSVLIPGNIIGTVWAIAPTLIAIVVVGWPQLPRKGDTAE